MSDPAPDPIADLFRQAFTTADPVTTLYKLLIDDPKNCTPRELVFAYLDKIDENPYNAQALTSILFKLTQQPTPNILSFSAGLPIIIFDELVDEFFNHPRDSEVTVYGPKNSHLLDALICGVGLQHKLARGGNELYMLFEALNAPHDGSERSQIMVVGACIQLLMGGHTFLPTLMSVKPGGYRATPNEIATMLKNQKCCVKDERAVEVLELAISHAEAGMKAEDCVEDVWSLLFPQSE